MEAFLGRRIGFLDIARIVEETLSVDYRVNSEAAGDLEAVLSIDSRARGIAADLCRNRAA